MSETSESALQGWLARLNTSIPILTAPVDIPKADSSVEDFEAVLKDDPIACLQLFRRLHYLSDGKLDNSPKTLKHLISLIGTEKTRQFLLTLPTLDVEKTQFRRMLMAITDSLVSASFLSSWHQWRQIAWEDSDHWASLFDNAGWWLIAWLDPMMAEGIEHRILAGEERDSVYRQIFGFSCQEWNRAVCELFFAPRFVNSTGMASKEGPEPDSVSSFKYKALNYYLPISQLLANVARAAWGGEQFKALLERASTATLIEGFPSKLKTWLAEAGRSSSLEYVGIPIRQVFADQPKMFVPGKEEADKKLAVSARPGRNNKKFNGDVSYFQTNLERLRQGGKSFETDLQIYELLLDAIHLGIGLPRAFVALHQTIGGSFRVEYQRGTEQFSLIQALAFKLDLPGVSEKLYASPLSFWLKEQQFDQLVAQLPKRLIQATDAKQFFIRTMHVGSTPLAAVYADRYPHCTPFYEQEYTMFRALVSAANSALEQRHTVFSL